MKIGDAVVVTGSGKQYHGKIAGAAYGFGTGRFYWLVDIDGSVYTYTEKEVKPFKG